MRPMADTLLKAAGTAAGAATGGAVLYAIHRATGGRWAFPADSWHLLAGRLGAPPAADRALVLGWCVLGCAGMALAVRWVRRAAVASGWSPVHASVLSAAAALNPAVFRLMFDRPAAGLAVLAALRIAAVPLERAGPARRPARTPRPAPWRFPVVTAIAVIWVALGLPGMIREPGRLAAAARLVMTAPAAPAVVPAGIAAPDIPGWSVSDSLRVADGADESRHGYRISGDATTEDGRVTGGRESFRLGAARQTPAILMARVTAPAGGRLRVIWNGVPLPAVRVGSRPAGARTLLIGEERGQRTGTANDIIIERPDGTRITAQGYWLLQPSR